VSSPSPEDHSRVDDEDHSGLSLGSQLMMQHLLLLRCRCVHAVTGLHNDRSFPSCCLGVHFPFLCSEPSSLRLTPRWEAGHVLGCHDLDCRDLDFVCPSPQHLTVWEYARICCLQQKLIAPCL